MKRTIAKILLITLLLSLAIGTVTSCGSDSRYAYAEIKTELGDITLKLYKNSAPITVENFLSLADSGFYDGLTFHRAQENFMIQGGDPNGNGSGSSANKIKGEFSSNGVDNKVSHLRGVISMARGKDPDSASCQFFICNADATQLDGSYAAFGEVIDGMDVVDAITAAMAPYGDPYMGTVYDKTKHIKIFEINRLDD